MQVKRYIITSKVNKLGMAPIYLTASWDGKRLKLFPEEKVHLEAWDNKLKKVKPKQTYTTRINGKLEAVEIALTELYDNARKANKALTEAEVKTEFDKAAGFTVISAQELSASAKKILQHLSPKKEAEPELESPFLQLMDSWINHKKLERDSKGNRLEASTITALKASRDRLIDFEATTKFKLTLAKMDNLFFQAFLNYMLENLGQSINTVGKHIKRLTEFLEWCEDQDLEVNRKYRKMSVTEEYQEVESLTEEEVHLIYNLDFRTQQAVDFVKQCFREEYKKEINRLMLAQRIKVLEEMQDVFLFLCYSGMRISDAFTFTPKDIHNGIIKIKAGKTKKHNIWCYIPYYDDAIFKPVEIVTKYQGKYNTCLPVNKGINSYLKYIGKFAGITRLELTTKIGRKTFATLKLYQGVPDRMVMQATGHKTEKAFVRYIGVNTIKLLENFQKRSQISVPVSVPLLEEQNN
ncbi:tyrosine-type recombinase/integrase [Adhaeribacter pallidiroseus]|uniref:Tyr recombinase domain-containing protein n=1 Tax=Adhaeribacter pallidiroseus TaxID=2072847 RepID=A0A369QKD7_9BACT|nr:tyrosine-type recombinase/integrase [Adhaeribacter pallidiroseus]RDC63319.1 hypothetical protein AHMF7616_01921 [Adhaeribacter pallidiroseus]